MARVVWRNNDLNNMISAVRAIPNEFLGASSDIVQSSAQEGAAQMRSYIETRGTGYNGHTGRIETGAMLADVDASEVTHTGRTVSAEYGWGITGNTVEPYFLYQENGFSHVGNGKDVPPMHALLDSFVMLREKFFSRIARLVK